MTDSIREAYDKNDLFAMLLHISVMLMKTLGSFGTGQRWVKTSKSTSRTVTAVKSTSPVVRLPQRYFNRCWYLSLVGNRFPSTSTQTYPRPKVRLSSPVLRFQDGSLHPNSSSY
jgi:hypothetical protein